MAKIKFSTMPEADRLAIRDTTGIYQNNKFSQLNRKTIQNSFDSVFNSQRKYEESASTLFTENFTDLSAWVLNATTGVQVSGNKLYSIGNGGGVNGMTHSYAIGATECIRYVCKISIPLMPTSGGIIIGVSSEAAGTVQSGAGAIKGIFISSGAVYKWNNTNTSISLGTFTIGDYYFSCVVDVNYISVSLIKSDLSNEILTRIARTGFDVNNLAIFNSDIHALTGMYISEFSARKGLQTIYPRQTYSEGKSKTIHYSGINDSAFTIYLPKEYDSRFPKPLCICWHGQGGTETIWTSNSNNKSIQNALIAAGYIVLGVSLDNDYSTWGKESSILAYYDAYKYVVANYAISSVVGYGQSMGAIESLNAIVDGDIPCAALALTAPAINMRHLYDNVLHSAITTAYGIAANGSDYDTKTEGRDPMLQNPCVFNGVPLIMIAALDDASVDKTQNMDLFAEKMANYSKEIQTIDVESGGHSFFTGTYAPDIIAFFANYI